MSPVSETLVARPEVSQADLARQERQSQAEKAIQRVNRLPVQTSAEYAVPAERALHVFGDPEQKKYDSVDIEVQRGASRSGMADAAHAVTVVNMELTGSEGIHTIEAAAKHYTKRPFNERAERLRMETSVMNDLRAQELPAFEPVAVAVMPSPTGDQAEGDLVLFTKFAPDIMTLDNYPWGRGAAPENVATAAHIMAALGTFNNLGYRHNDAKVKNAAQREADGKFTMVDFETTQRVDHADPFEAAVTVDADFKTMVDSLVKKGFLAEADIAERENALAQLAEAYVDTWANAPNQTQEAILAGVVDACDQLVKAEY